MRSSPSAFSQNPVIMGIDPGYDRLGWSVARFSPSGWHEVQLGCIQTERTLDLIERYQVIEQELQEVLDRYKPSEAGIETLYFTNNTTTGLKIAEVRGLIIACLLRNKIKVAQYNPVKIKQAVTGNGRADKRAIEKMIKMEFKLNTHDYLDDALDALAVLLTHHLYQQNRQLLA